jgi:transposase
VYHLSVRAVIAMMRDAYGVEMSEGAVIACQEAATKAVEAPVAEAHAYVQEQPVVNADETGWRQGNKTKAWLWVAVTPLVTVFLIHLRRSEKAAKALLAEFRGILTTDRWKAYVGWALKMRQLCWAHLKRDFVQIAERHGISRRIGRALLKDEKLLFRWWHKLQRGEISRSTFQRYVAPLRERVRGHLSEGTEARNRKTVGTCKEMLSVFDAMWTFVYVEGVEPTNNAAERAIRPAVLWRKNSFGTKSEAGSRFVERILTVAGTLRQQGRNVLQYMTAAIQARLDGTPAPSLLPVRVEAQARLRA